MRTRVFWIDTAERAVRTAAQTFIASVATTLAVQQVAWDVVGGTVALATLVSVATSIVASGKGDPTSASLVAPPVTTP